MTNPEPTTPAPDSNVFDLDALMPSMAFKGLAQYGVPDGVVPEPSDAAVFDWQARLNAHSVKVRLDVPPNATWEQVADAVMAKDQEALNLDIVDAYAVLCGATPPPEPRPERPQRPRGKKRDTPTDDGEEYDEPTKAQLQAYERKLAAYREDLNRWVQAWSGGTPTRAQFAVLPFRVQKVFFGWLAGKFRDQDFGGAATSA